MRSVEAPYISPENLKKARKLIPQARKAAVWRGHSLSQFVRLGGYNASGHPVYRAHCAACGKSVDVTPQPAPNEIDIGGEVVAINCELEWSKA